MMDAEQIVRLTAAVLWEMGRPRIDGEDTRDALTLRLADAVGIALATEPAPAPNHGPHRPPSPARGPRATSETRGLWVKDYPAAIAATPASAPTPLSSPDRGGERHEA